MSIPYVNNLTHKSSRIVILSTLIKEMKQILYTGHLGIERAKSSARSTIYWPNIEKKHRCQEISNYKTMKYKLVKNIDT